MIKGSKYLLALLLSPAAFASPPSINISWSPSTVNIGGTSTLSWNVTGATSCVDQNNSPAGMSLTWTSSPRTVPGVQTKTLICTGPGGRSSASASLTILAPPPPPPPPSVSVSWSPSTVYVGETSTLSWSSSGADYCRDQNGASVATSLSWTSSPRTSPGSQTKTITCTNNSGSSTDSATLTIRPRPPKPSVSASFSPSSITLGQSTAFSWSSNNASYCTLDGSNVSTSGSRNYTPSSNISKTVTCYNNEGNSSASASAVVGNPATPVIQVSWSPQAVQIGETSTLKWEISHATNCTDGITGASIAPQNGSWHSSPRTGNSTKSIQCYNQRSQFNSSSSSTLNVTSANAPTNFQASRNGTGINLSWQAPSHNNAAQLTYKVEESVNGSTWAQVSNSSSTSLSLSNRNFNQSLNYRISTCYQTFCGNTVSASIAALQKPEINISWSKNPVEKGEQPILSWTVTNATHCKDLVTGEEVNMTFSWISPPRTLNTTKTLECYNQIAENSSQKSANLVVNPITPPTNFTSQRKSDGTILLKWDPKNYTVDEPKDKPAPEHLFFVVTESTDNGQATNITVPYKGSSISRSNTNLDKSYQYSIKSCFENECSAAVRADLDKLSKPKITITWSKNPVQAGEKPKLTWTISNATECYDTDHPNEVVNVENRTVEVSPRTLNTTKKITCINQSDSLKTNEKSELTVEDPKVSNLTLASNNTLTWSFGESVAVAHNNSADLKVTVEGQNTSGAWQQLHESNGIQQHTISNSQNYKAFRVTACYDKRCSPATSVANSPEFSANLNVQSPVEPFQSSLINWSIQNGKNCQLKVNNKIIQNPLPEKGNTLTTGYPENTGSVAVQLVCEGQTALNKSIEVKSANTEYIDISGKTAADIQGYFAASSNKKHVLYGKANLQDNNLVLTSLNGLNIDASSATIEFALKTEKSNTLTKVLAPKGVVISGISSSQILLPKVLSPSHTDAIGVSIDNTSDSTIYLPLIQKSALPQGVTALKEKCDKGSGDCKLVNPEAIGSKGIGLKIHNAMGSVNNNNFILGKLFLSTVNLRLEADSTKCTNPGYQIATNKFYAGQVARETVKVDDTPNSKMLEMVTTTPSCINNNTWFSTSFEGVTAGTASRAQIVGNNNNFINNRWEGIKCKKDCHLITPQITLRGEGNRVLSGYDHGYFIDSLLGNIGESLICSPDNSPSTTNTVEGWNRPNFPESNEWAWHLKPVSKKCN